MKRVVVLSGAGISAESGLQTFRGAGGLWEGHRVEADIQVGDRSELGSQLRPHIVWFGEMVPAMDEAVNLVAAADVLLVVGTSLQVYPAAGLVFEAPKRCRRIVVNPDVPDGVSGSGFEVVAKPATVGVPEVVADLLAGV